MSVPTLTKSPNAFQQPRKSHPMLWIVLGSTIGVLLFAALVGASAFFALRTFFQQTDQPVPVAGNYYLALMTQDLRKPTPTWTVKPLSMVSKSMSQPSLIWLKLPMRKGAGFSVTA